MTNLTKTGMIVGLVIAAIALTLIIALYLKSPVSLSTTGSLPISLTDPPQVPSGTTALIIDYSSVKAGIYAHKSDTLTWVNASGAGSLNLLTLINLSQVIATANLPANTTLKRISFNITAAHIIINGTTYNVTLPSSRFSVGISNNSLLNGSQEALIDFSPTIVVFYTPNATLFVMVPSVRAILARRLNTLIRVGSIERLNAVRIAVLRGLTPGTVISSASAAVNGNASTIALTVHNEGNTTAILRQAYLYGNFSVSIAPFAHTDFIAVNTDDISKAYPDVSQQAAADDSFDYLNSSVNAINSALGQAGSLASSNAEIENIITIVSGIANNINISGTPAAGNKTIEINNGGVAWKNGTLNVSVGNVHIGISNVSKLISINGKSTGIMIENTMGVSGLGSNDINVSTPLRNNLNNTLKEGIRLKNLKVIGFVVANNCVLELPDSLMLQTDHGIAVYRRLNGSGCTLAPGANATLTFSGKISVADGRISVSLIPNGTYRAGVLSEAQPYGGYAVANITATGS